MYVRIALICCGIVMSCLNTCTCIHMLVHVHVHVHLIVWRCFIVIDCTKGKLSNELLILNTIINPSELLTQEQLTGIALSLQTQQAFTHRFHSLFCQHI